MPDSLLDLVARVVRETPVFDIHTHLYAPAFGPLLLFGIDELLIYHYIAAEGFRFLTVPPAQFWALSKTEQADLLWRELFVQRSPLSEACRSVITTLNRLGLDPRPHDLARLRAFFKAQKPDEFTTRCMELAGVSQICMTNSPFDAQERVVWQAGFGGDERFASALRLDPLLMEWPRVTSELRALGCEVEGDLGGATIAEIRRFLRVETRRMKPLYLMVSLPPDFAYPAADARTKLLDEAILPHCREHGLPFALMMGVKRAVNPALKLAGDGMGRADLSALQNLCQANPDVKFLATVLARENQQELAVLARKFGALHPFGCWWFCNVPSIIEETTRLRLELLGPSFTFQHSDARVLDQLIPKWEHARAALIPVLAERYALLAAQGWTAREADVQRDAKALLGGEFRAFLAR